MTEKKLLSIEEIDGVDDTAYVEVDVPEWKGTIRFGSLPAGAMIEWVESNDGPAKRTAGIRLLIRSLVDMDGKRIGTDKHIEIFKKRDARVCNRLLDVVLEMNGLSAKKQEAAKNDSSEAVSDVSPTVLH